jgi:RNA-dependent RNA polymerase
MGKVSYSVSEAQLHHKLAEVLHGPDYHRFFTSGAPLNFVVQLFHRRGQIGHKGCGLLHLPLVSVGQQFLSQYGGIFATRHVVVGMRRVEFKESDRPIRPDILDRINLLPYRDPAVVKEEQRIRSEYASGVIRIQTIQWGWETREPGVFSAEYERDCQGRGHLIFQDEPREIRIKTSVASETRIIAIPLGQIQSISVGLVNGQPIIFLSLNRAPIYESEVSTLEDNFAQLDLDLSGVFSRPGAPPPQRRRHSSFDDQHAATAAYSSLAIRLVCSREGDLNVFRSLCRTAKLTDWLNNHPPQAERGSLFSSSVRDRFAAWLQDLPWEVAFQVEMITRHLYMDLVEMLSLKDDIDRISSHPVEASAILREFSSQVRDLFYQDQYEAETVRECFVRCHEEFTRSRKKPPRVSRDKDDIFDCYHVMITPTSHRLEGPYPERLNRVIRKYPKHTDCFIRVSFVDENKLLYRFDRDVDGPDFIRRRVASVLQELVIAGQRLEFLAYSQSALKEHSVWYIRPFFDLEAGHVVDAPRIIRDLGNFHNLAYDEKMGRCPARYAARVSQSFTATDSSVSMEVDEVFPINDIERNGWCFSDGVGTISPELADDICRALYNRSRRRRRPLVKPRAFQIRFQGAKGMLSVDDRLRGRAICLRPSMIKFDAPNSNDIEIAQAFDRPSRYYLNRPLIMLLEDLGVPYKVFEAFQDAAVEDAENASESLNRTARLLDGHGLGTSFRITSVLQHLEQKLGITTMHDPFYRRMQEFAVHHVLREMKHKARIPVPGGWILVGVADIHGFLGPRDIFACTRCPDCRKNIYFEGPTLVSRSPTIHPGDVQVLNAIGRPPSGSPFEREPLKNSIVFSIQGTFLHFFQASKLNDRDQASDLFLAILGAEISTATRTMSGLIVVCANARRNTNISASSHCFPQNPTRSLDHTKLLLRSWSIIHAPWRM